MTIATPIRVLDAPRIAASESAMEQLIDGLGNAEAESYTTARIPRWDMDDYTYEKVGTAYETEVVEAAIAEIAPAVAAMLEAAIAKRLPWTWERDR